MQALIRHTLKQSLSFMVFFIVILLVSCRPNNQALRETPTSGNISIAVDEAFQPLVSAELTTFLALYPDAHIIPSYKHEPDVINDFLRDSVKIMVTSKMLTEDQIVFLRDSLIFPITTPFFSDALAFITNKDNPDTLFNYEEIVGLFKGSFSNWTDINPSSELGEIRVIFDNTRSGNIRFLKDTLQISGALPGNFFALNSTQEVIDFVAGNRDALGIVSFSYISDKDSRKQMSYLEKVNMIAVSPPRLNNSNNNIYYRPSQGTLYDKSYPFCREVYFISRETFAGLGSGFVQFATGDQGQRIALKAGLLPSKMPPREVRAKR